MSLCPMKHTLGNVGLEFNRLKRLFIFIISLDHLGNYEVGVTWSLFYSEEDYASEKLSDLPQFTKLLKLVEK